MPLPRARSALGQQSQSAALRVFGHADRHPGPREYASLLRVGHQASGTLVAYAATQVPRVSDPPAAPARRQQRGA